MGNSNVISPKREIIYLYIGKRILLTFIVELYTYYRHNYIIVLWCNGSIIDSWSVGLGSNPKMYSNKVRLLSIYYTYGLLV